MKKFFYPILFIILLLSCQKSPINGDLDGQWEVVEVYPEPEKVIIHERLYYNFYLHVCMLSYYGGTTAYANMNYNGETMVLDFKEQAPEGSLRALPQYGILINPVAFNVEFTSSHNMTLSNEESLIVLVKH